MARDHILIALVTQGIPYFIQVGPQLREDWHNTDATALVVFCFAGSHREAIPLPMDMRGPKLQSEFWRIQLQIASLKSDLLSGGFCSRTLSGDLRYELCAVDRLRCVVVAADAEAFVTVTIHRVRSEGDDGAAIAFAAEQCDRFVAVEHGHLHVHQDDVESLFALGRLQGRIDGEAAVFHNGNFRAGLFENEGNEPLIIGTILGQQDPPTGKGLRRR